MWILFEIEISDSFVKLVKVSEQRSILYLLLLDKDYKVCDSINYIKNIPV